MKTILAIFSLCFAALSLTPSLQAADPPAKPNILYLIADQWRASATGYAGDPNVKTPNLDRLAKESQNFRNAVSVLPVCTPHRAALMTGRYPTSTGMFLNDAHLPDEELCLAEIFGAAGYATGYIGKWHLDGHGREAYIPPERRQGWQYWKAAECDHEYNHSHYYTGDSDVKQYWEGYDAFAQTRDAQQYLRDHATNGRPFVLMVAYGVPHFPHKTAPEEFKAMYPPEKIKLPPNVPPALQNRARQEAQGYYAHCTALDQSIGDLLGTLAETGLASNTIVVFSSDHGEMLGSQGVAPTQKQVVWSESAEVPFLLRVPGLGGRTVTAPITTPDVLPTLLGLSGVAVPKTVEGEDLSPLLRSGRDADRAALYMSVSPFTTGVSPDKSKEYRAIRTSRYTYARSLDGPWLLFDNTLDSFQTNNLVGKAEHAALVKELDAKLQKELQRIGDDFRPGKDHIAEWGYQVAPHGSLPYAANITDVQTPRRQTAPAAGFTSETVVYKKAGERELHLYVEKPSAWKPTDRRPAIVFFFGGSWIGGKPTQFQWQSEYFATRGMVGIRVEYRVTSKNDKNPPIVCCQDAKSAMRWVRAHAAELGIDPQRIAGSGGSAGAHLAAFSSMVGGTDDPADDLSVSPKADALVLFNPVFDNGPDGGFGTARIGDRYREFSPAHNITSNAPPTIVFLGDKDHLISTNVLERFKANMTRAGVRCDAHVYAGQEHGFFNQEPFKTTTLIEADKFLGSLGWLKGVPTITIPEIKPGAPAPEKQ